MCIYMYISVVSVKFLSYSSLLRDIHLSAGFLPNVAPRFVWSSNLQTEEVMTRVEP